jgi:hypothetical protein
MAAILPALFLALSLLRFVARDTWRVAIVKAGIVFGLAVVVNTEILSLATLLVTPAVAVAWAIECLAAGLGVFRRRASLAARLRGLPVGWPPARVWAVGLPIAFILGATAVTAWVAPPNTYDSMAYHMARVGHWVADRSIADYPTNIVRQLYEPPWAEYAILQLQILSGGDGLANLVQWFGLAGSIACVSLIGRQLGAPMSGQLMAAVVVATLPMGILQASSTQTDLVEAFWLVCAVSLALSFATDRTAASAAWFAAALGLAALTKGTAYIFAAPLMAALACWMIVRFRRRLLLPAVLMIAIPLLINSGQYVRNQALFGNPLAERTENQEIVNTTFAPNAVVSNVLRDSVLQFGTPSSAVNDAIQRVVVKIHNQVLHIGLNDPRTTWPDVTFAVNPTSLDEDYAGDPLQAVLVIIAIVAVLVMAFRSGLRLLGLYAAGLVLAFVLFAAYLRWQPWHSRLELPLLVLSSPLVGVVLGWASGSPSSPPGLSRDPGGTRLRPLVPVVAALLFLGAVPWTFENASRPLLPFALPREARYVPAGRTIFDTSRIDLYFAKRPELETPYSNAIARAEQDGCREIGLQTGPADWEYPLWVLAATKDGARIDQIMVNNESAHLAQFGAAPCALIVVVPDKPATIDIGELSFTRVSVDNGVGLYEPA